ncbi:MAG: hypothetical protein IK130_01615 [Oscillospiraceae bacterium]|nr:hypothetical protein [Oscillospiraceae bacterium]
MIELRKVSRQIQDYPSPDALERAVEAVTVRTYEDYLAGGHAWAWCMVGNIVHQHTYGENQEIRYGSKQFSGGTKVFCAPAAWGDGYENIVVIGTPRFKRSYIEVIMRSEYIENFRMQRIFKPAVLKRMCASPYRWWGDLDEDRAEIIAYLESRTPEEAKRLKGLSG